MHTVYIMCQYVPPLYTITENTILTNILTDGAGRKALDVVYNARLYIHAFFCFQQVTNDLDHFGALSRIRERILPAGTASLCIKRAKLRDHTCNEMQVNKLGRWKV
jgi:hypothetical protein